MAGAKRERLGKEDITTIFRKGKRIQTPFFILWVVQKKTLPFRLAIICSKKVEKRAVRRNSIRRRMREVFRKDIRAKISPIDAVVQVLPAGKALTSLEIRKTLYDVLHIS